MDAKSQSTRPFRELREGMSPESQARAAEKAAALDRQTAVDEVLLEAVRQAWSDGYQTAIDALCDMADQGDDDDDLTIAIRALAGALQEIKP